MQAGKIPIHPLVNSHDPTGLSSPPPSSLGTGRKDVQPKAHKLLGRCPFVHSYEVPLHSEGKLNLAGF